MTSRRLAAILFGAALYAAPTLALAQSTTARQGTTSTTNDSAEDDSGWRQDTLLGSHRTLEQGGYGSVLVRASALNHDPALFVGGRGGWLLGHRLLLGAAGAGQVLTVHSPEAAIEDYPDGKNLEFGYGGAFIAYHFLPERLLHPTAGLLIGAGGIALSNRHFHDMNQDEREFAANGVFIVEPEASLEVNMLDSLRLEFTLSYRQALGVDLPGLGNSDVSGLAGGIAILMGKL